jgi:carbohydrate-selective porin OprB
MPPRTTVTAGSGAGAYGYAPGLSLAYTNDSAKPVSYGLSAVVFAAGPGAQYNHSFSSPFVIVQAETKQKLIDGLDGNYRAYFWRTGQGVNFDQSVAKHAGWGFNLDQRIGDAYTLFARYGKETTGQVQFDRTTTAGVEVGGTYGGRAADALGLAYGDLRTSSDFRNQSATLDADSDGQPDFGYQAQGSEQLVEVYYRLRIHKQFELSPDFQYIRHPGGNREQTSMKVLGLRAQVNF